MKTYDVIVIGSGIAGLTFAYKIAPYGKIGIITKKSGKDSNTNYAQGGIAAVLNENDSFEIHEKDTYSAGKGLSRSDAVKIMVERGPELVMELAELGAEFDMNENGSFTMSQEGGHSKKRIVHSGDYTGYEIEKTLLDTINLYPNIEMLTNHYICDLIIDNENTCQGVFVLDKINNEIEPYFSKFVVLATGGIGQVYKHTTNPDIATGDGIAMAYRAGAKIANMEFVQFHPTTLYNSESEGRAFLISEAVRGEGAFLKLKNNRQFMHKYHELKSLAPRDIVARAIDAELKLSGEDYVLLDLSPFSEKGFERRFPRIFRKCRDLGINVPSEPIPVVPAAHYICGGIQTNIDAKTSINNLYAAGEAACTGVHGANRLASNSLLEAIVFAERAFLDIKQKLGRDIEATVPGFYSQPVSANDSICDYINELKINVKEVMWKRLAIVRDMKGVIKAREEISRIWDDFQSMEKYNTEEYFQLRNMIIVSKIIIESALSRKESRGLHYMKDFPETNDNEFRHDTIIHKEV
ncbi:MAG: L-aspartate oxidase [candidate division WOR-3 bacterium]|nr:L-aspartate oxidase [candidate division WOR-3 bacterium]